jgi:transcriptional regulator with XRE-family HTH domain
VKASIRSVSVCREWAAAHAGLRREEVAMLADVGVTWYTWLEQGREVNPSESVLVGVANALQCSPLETRHLFVLAG